MIYLLDASFINYFLFLSSVFRVSAFLFLSFNAKLPMRKNNVLFSNEKASERNLD